MQNEELIQSLRSDAEWAHGNEWETPITLGDNLDAAADALEAAEKRIVELEAAQRWIPCAERLPENVGSYLAYYNEWSNGVCQYAQTSAAKQTQTEKSPTGSRCPNRQRRTDNS